MCTCACIVEISAIFPGFVQASAPAPDSAPAGLFLALMNEVTAPLPEEAVPQKIEMPAEWTLLNANAFKGTSTPEGDTAEAEPEKQESANDFLTIATPPVVIETQPLRPLGLNIALATMPVKQQENTVEEVNVTRPAPVERGGESAPEAELAFAAKIISKEDASIEAPAVK